MSVVYAWQVCDMSMAKTGRLRGFWGARGAISQYNLLIKQLIFPAFLRYKVTDRERSSKTSARTQIFLECAFPGASGSLTTGDPRMRRGFSPNLNCQGLFQIQVFLPVAPHTSKYQDYRQLTGSYETGAGCPGTAPPGPTLTSPRCRGLCPCTSGGKKLEL